MTARRTRKTVPAAAARSLAIRYQAYHEARANGDDNGIVCWAEMLIDSQEETGIEFHSTEGLRRDIEFARARRDAKRAA